MASAFALLPDSRRAAPTPVANRRGRRAQPHGRLIHLLAVSLLLHLALLAWPTGPGAGGQTRGARLAATLAGRHEGTDQAARQADKARSTTSFNIASQEAPMPSRPAAKAETSEESEGAPVPTVQSPAEPATNLPPAPAIPALAASAATLYYPADQLTVRPRALAEPLLDPDPLTAFVASGEIAFTLWIDERGQVAEIDVERSELPAVFAQTAAEAFRELRFAPGEIDGRPVGSVLRIAVRYDDERLAGDHDASREFAVEPAT